MAEIENLAHGPFAPEQISVLWKTDVKRLARHTQDYIDTRWAVYVAEAKAKGHELFNGPITQFVNYASAGGVLTLQLGSTDYKTFLVTSVRDRPWFTKFAPHAMATALGNSVLLTFGDQAILGLRAASSGAYPEKAHLFGGVLERLDEAPGGTTTVGMLGHLKKELAEELKLEERDLVGPPKALALLKDTFLGQPELVWQQEISIPPEHLDAQLNLAEHSAIVVVNRGQQIETTQGYTPVAVSAVRRWMNPGGGGGGGGKKHRR